MAGLTKTGDLKKHIVRAHLHILELEQDHTCTSTCIVPVTDAALCDQSVVPPLTPPMHFQVHRLLPQTASTATQEEQQHLLQHQLASLWCVSAC